MIPDNAIIKSLSDKFHLGESGQKEFMNHLADAINNLIQNDFSGLVQILYRMDVSESKLKEMLVKHANEDAGLIIGQLLIQREALRIQSREKFKGDDNIPEQEKW